MKNYALISALSFAFLVSCQQKQEPKKAEAVTALTKPIVLSGKKIRYDYGASQYEVTVKNDTLLRWKSLSGISKGTMGEERYYKQDIAPGIIFISWIEKDGLGVSQVVNWNTHVVNSYLRIDNQIIPISGTLTEVQ